MFLYTASVSALLTTRKVVLEIVHLDMNSSHITRLTDVLHILHIRSLLVVRE